MRWRHLTASRLWVRDEGMRTLCGVSDHRHLIVNRHSYWHAVVPQLKSPNASFHLGAIDHEEIISHHTPYLHVSFFTICMHHRPPPVAYTAEPPTMRRSFQASHPFCMYHPYHLHLSSPSPSYWPPIFIREKPSPIDLHPRRRAIDKTSLYRGVSPCCFLFLLLTPIQLGCQPATIFGLVAPSSY